MVLYQKPVKKKSSGSGGKRIKARDKRLAQYGGFFSRPHVAKEGEKQVSKSFRVIGGGMKTACARIAFANVATPEGVKKAKVLTVVETPANRHFARENVVVKSAIIETDLGKARVTSRPGQDGVVNAVLLKK